PNFRITNYKPIFSFNPQIKPFKIVYMARIMLEKGIDIIFDFALHLKLINFPTNTILIDFYGPITKKDEKLFFDKIKEFDYLNYKGIVDPKDVYKKMAEYDILILPTRYEGEGFPGTILDAYMCGIPVIVSNWKYLPEYVENGITGFVFDLNNLNMFYDSIFKLYHDRRLLLEMKISAHKKSEEFSSDFSWGILKEYFK
ncbi:MAG: glycosyltransferase family 4 protein, partial [Ginsengibacter sp.]